MAGGVREPRPRPDRRGDPPGRAGRGRPARAPEGGRAAPGRGGGGLGRRGARRAREAPARDVRADRRKPLVVPLTVICTAVYGAAPWEVPLSPHNLTRQGTAGAHELARLSAV